MSELIDVIPIGSRIPRRGGRLSQRIFAAVLGLMGWRITGSIPDEPKMVMIAGPHTSNWDFVMGVLCLFTLGLKVRWIGKHTIFVGPFGTWLRHFGGIPVNRSSPGALFRDVLNGFKENEAFIFGLSPEGTRSKVAEWKPGFHRIARAAGVPLLLVGVDFGRITMHFGPLYEVSDDFEADVSALKVHYNSFTAKHPELF